MRCKQCDYTLWNLKARQCPECGAAFVPADYEFVVNSVRYCCPHCDQSYYGTGEKGHLVPAEFNCVTCSRPVTMNQMVLRPAEGVQEQQTQADYMPWLMRQQLGWWRGWMKTVGYSMVKPHLLMRATPIETGTGQAWWFACASCLIIFGCGIGLALLGIGLLVLANGGRDPIGTLIAAPIATVSVTAAFLIGVLIWGLATHGLLKISGGCAHSLGRTYSALLYSIGANAPLAIPALGPYCLSWIIWIWWSVSAIFMVAEGQKVHGGRAAFAVLTLPIIIVTLAFGGYFVAIYAIMSQVATRQANLNNASTAVGETSTLVQAVLQYALKNKGQGPRHALELVNDQTIGVTNFIGTDSLTAKEDVPVSDTSLDQIELLPPNKLAMTIKAAVNSLPDDVIAHRLGDFVFTYHGIDLSAPKPMLWIVVYSPDPDVDSISNPSRPIVGFADGTARALPGRLTSELRNQNALRAQYNLPPLPDPSTVRHSRPARSGRASSGANSSADDGAGVQDDNQDDTAEN
jgi:hypothetical protein